MIRILLLFTIMASLGLRCIAVSIEQVSAGQSPQIPGAAPGPSAQATPPPRPPEQVSPDAPVVTIQGLCPDGQQRLEQSDSCTLVFTRSQFEAMVKAVNVTDQNYTLPALKSLATSYVTVLTLADAAEKEGIDKDPRFQELLKVSRERSLADAYRLYLKEKFSNPSQAEIEEYYNKNIAKFEQVKVDRILIPKVNSKRSQEKPEEFEKKARQLAEAIRERAAKGEAINALQAEVYKTLGIESTPAPTEVAAGGKASWLPAVQADINALTPGQVTQVETEPSGFYVYKLRSRTVAPLERVRTQVIYEVSHQNIEAALKAITGKVHSQLNEQYFNPKSMSPPPPARLPGSSAPRGAVSSGQSGQLVPGKQ